MTLMLELSDKEFKTRIIKILQRTIVNILEINEEHRKKQQRNRRCKEIFKWKNTTEFLKMGGLTSRVERNRKISKLEERRGERSLNLNNRE